MNVKIFLEVDIFIICKFFFFRYGVIFFVVCLIGKGFCILLNFGLNYKMSIEDRCFYIVIFSEEDIVFKVYKELKKLVSLFKGSFRYKNDLFIIVSFVVFELNIDFVEVGNIQKL